MQYQLFDALTPDEYQALKADIAERGVLVPVEVDECGVILDGHHRIRAWTELRAEGVKLSDYPRIVRAGMTEEQKRNHVRALNILRRHLSKEQLVKTMRDMRQDGTKYDEIAKVAGVSYGTAYGATRDVLNIKTDIENERGQQRPATYERKQPTAPPVSIFAATSEQETLARRAAPMLDETDGMTTAKYAYKQATENRRAEIANSRQEAQAPSGKYRVIYADPPWAYGNTMPEGTTQPDDHYMLMTVAEIAAMPIKAIAEDNAVLFLWVTSPILAESFQVIEAWGFQYKSSFVWDKIKHNMGHYNSVRHELLLVCVRGSCQPDVKKLFDSVVSIERTEHSVKPEFFREIIDTIYPSGKRIELFARRHSEGWEAYGNELPR